MTLAPFVHQRAFLGGALGQQQGAVVTGGLEVAFTLLDALLGVVDKLPALVQVVPVHLAVTLRNLRGAALVAQRCGHGDVLAGVAVRAWLVIQRPHQARQLAATLAGQLLERFRREGAGAHGRNGCDAMVEQGDGIEDALDDPQFFHLQQIHTRRAPPVALG